MQTKNIYLATSPTEAKKFDTEEIRKRFLISPIFSPDNITIYYTTYDRYVVGGVQPVNKPVQLEVIDELRSDYFLERRELGIINIGQTGIVKVDGTAYTLENQEALYVGRGVKNVVFENYSGLSPLFYFNSTPAHKSYPIEKISSERAQFVELGDDKNSNKRRIKKLIVQEIIPTCQLQMGLTMLYEGNVWNTMPAHTHLRRMEVYFYFDIDLSLIHI